MYEVVAIIVVKCPLLKVGKPVKIGYPNPRTATPERHQTFPMLAWVSIITAEIRVMMPTDLGAIQPIQEHYGSPVMWVIQVRRVLVGFG